MTASNNNIALRDGVLPDHEIRKMIDEEIITSDHPISDERIQPASLDLSVSGEGYRVGKITCSDFVPERVRQALGNDGKLDLSQRIRQEADVYYLVRNQESFELPYNIRAYANPKSTSGRDNQQVRLLTENDTRFDCVPAGYKGNIWIEMVPSSFPITFAEETSFNQIRFFRGKTECDQNALRIIHSLEPLIYTRDGIPFADEQLRIQDFGTGKPGIILTLDLKCGRAADHIVGYRSKKNIDKTINYFSSIAPPPEGKLDPEEFFDPITGPLTHYNLEPGYLYILGTLERFRVPSQLCATFANYDASFGELRAHYAGFFDPGWGYLYQKIVKEDGTVSYILIPEHSRGATATLEILVQGTRSIRVRHGQEIASAIFDIIASNPSRPYRFIEGEKERSNYGDQPEARLSKHFKPWPVLK